MVDLMITVMIINSATDDYTIPGIADLNRLGQPGGLSAHWVGAATGGLRQG